MITRISRSVGQSRPRSARDRPADRTILDAIEETGICQQLSDIPTSRLLGEIKTGLNGAPVEQLAARIIAHRKSITGLGMIRDLARDVAKAHARASTRVAPGSPSTAVQDECARREAAALLADPAASESDRQLARETLGPRVNRGLRNGWER